MTAFLLIATPLTPLALLVALTVPGLRARARLPLTAQRYRVSRTRDKVVHYFEVTEPVGRRLDFLMQELNREANTLSAKSADTDTTRAAVELKVLIEQMREQIQNIE